MYGSLVFKRIEGTCLRPSGWESQLWPTGSHALLIGGGATSQLNGAGRKILKVSSLQRVVWIWQWMLWLLEIHYCDVIMSAMGYQITGVSVVYSTVCTGADQRKHQSSAWLAFVRGIHRWLVNPPHRGPVTQKMFPFDDVIMYFFSLDSSYE